ncbi:MULTISPECIES: hypothetical protein [unclassified Leptolyngbya]|uniref:hypothetical protein n=1 Tax=unclassified Leptolyngbya TaxID=2650499 RepID=UPI00168483CA|nr:MULTISPECIES: hypothetical protein [unclassified Leptolyngbya]MBD1913904.1 hypothetical protein [Leptolyngbya sp. FACHB-8]MBD2156356.1 hypothetical protein [Leptolyngbya sp. FACHB-16]
MKRPEGFETRYIALFTADSNDVRERLNSLNQKLQSVVETIPPSWLESFSMQAIEPSQQTIE